MKNLGFLSILTIIFVVAKIGGYIDWSWWLVFSPTIFGVVLALVLLLFVIVISWAEK